jgi:hypothetical protein
MKLIQQYLFNLLTISILLPFALPLKAQPDVFLKGPDKNIHTVIGIQKPETGFCDTVRIYKYNPEGLLLNESMPCYYMFVDYQYDTYGRMLQKDALYGESFANGTTYYRYQGDTIYELSHLLVSYQKALTIKGKGNKTLYKRTWRTAGLGAESSIHEMSFEYSPEGQILKSISQISYHNYSNEDGEFEIDENTDYPSEIEKSPLVRKEKTQTTFRYRKKRLVSEITINPETHQKLAEITYLYNKNSAITEKKEVTYTTSFFTNDKPVLMKQIRTTYYKYDRLNDLSEVISISDGYSQTYIYQNNRLIKEIEAGGKENAESTSIEYHYIYY